MFKWIGLGKADSEDKSGIFKESNSKEQAIINHNQMPSSSEIDNAGKSFLSRTEPAAAQAIALQAAREQLQHGTVVSSNIEMPAELF